jgi:hypothetical protein
MQQSFARPRRVRHFWVIGNQFILPSRTVGTGKVGLLSTGHTAASA